MIKKRSVERHATSGRTTQGLGGRSSGPDTDQNGRPAGPNSEGSSDGFTYIHPPEQAEQRWNRRGVDERIPSLQLFVER